MRAPLQEETSQLTQRTIDYYNRNATGFWEGTRDHDVTQNIEAFLAAMPAGRRRVLDLGCGPGRDLKVFSERGHDAIGLDGSRELAAMAREYSGCPVWERDFLALGLEPESFDGIFANASLFHVPRGALGRVLAELHCALRVSGVLFSSNPRGDSEAIQADRYGNYLEFDAYRGWLEAAGFEVLHHYYRPTGLPRDLQPWLAVVSRKR